jgi:hypothetical protein
VWGKEIRFGRATVDLLRQGGEAEDRGASRVIRCVAGVDVARDRRRLWTWRLRSRLWKRRRVLLGPSRACDRCDGWRRNGARVGGRTRGRAARLSIGSGREDTRGWGAAAGEPLPSASSSGAGPSRGGGGRLGSAATPSRPPGGAERGSPATRLCAWARRNSDQLGPIRRGAGPRPALRNTVAIVVPETLIPSPFSSPWMRMYPQPGFSRASRVIRLRISAGSGGRPSLRLRRRRSPSSSARCQRRSVCGLIAKQDHRAGGSRRLAAASKARSAVVYRGRLPERLRIAS